MSSSTLQSLVEEAFPVRQASLDSVHEKMCHSGHIKALHVWPARRPLAACRAALIATLLPDPGNEAERQRLLDRLAGKVVTKNTKKRVGGRDVQVLKEETEGGILHWGLENGPDLEFFREEIRKAYGGRAPRVLDPFAGGGAIPFEAMRLGCEATAIDINPVAWFILKCTLEYPQRLAGQTRPLPSFALESPEFMAEFLKQTGKAKKGRGRNDDGHQPTMLEPPEADLAWHVRAWGHWVWRRAKLDLEELYAASDGTKILAFLWARTVTCKNCRATLPLISRLWLSTRRDKRRRLRWHRRQDGSGVDFDVVEESKVGGNAAQQRAHDRRVGQGTMSRSGAWCPACGGPGSIAMTLDDIRAAGMAGRLGSQMIAVVIEGPSGKEYRPPTAEEMRTAEEAGEQVADAFRDVPFGIPTERLPTKEALGFRVPLYGLDAWYKLFTPRQLIALGTFVKHTRASNSVMKEEGYPDDWAEAILAYLACAVSKLADYNSSLVRWQPGGGKAGNTFVRWALPIVWDFAENNLLFSESGGYRSILTWITKPIAEALTEATRHSPAPSVVAGSVLALGEDSSFDLVVTDPPYYDAIPYSDLMDFFGVWLRRILVGSPSSRFDDPLAQPLGPKWSREAADGELIDDASRFEGDAGASKAAYEDGMFRAFQNCWQALVETGRLVVVFANKQPEAWETLVSGIIRAGFVVEASWPIQTEMANRTRAQTSAALASSVWLVCRKRSDTARPGWDTQVLEEMRSNIHQRLRDFWDAGIRGPDFVWAATGPALEAYSKHPVVKKADEPNAVLTVSEFLHHVRRIVVDYVVGRVLSRDGESEEAEALDNHTIYYLLHRHDFGFTEAPVGACILYAQSCNLRDRDLADRYDLVAFTSGSADEDEDEDTEGEEGADEPEERGSGSKVRLKRWDQRRSKNLGLDAGGGTAPLIDQVHRIMRLWREGDVRKVDDYIEERGLRRNAVFPRVLQALVELARKDNQPDERALLETIMNHVTARGAHPQIGLRLETSGEGG